MIVNNSLHNKQLPGTLQLSCDTLTQIFLSLDFSTLKVCPHVCLQWKNVVFHPHFQYAKRLLEKKYGKAGSDHLHDLIHNKQLTLGNVIQYALLIKFLNSSANACSLNNIEYMENFEDPAQMPFCFNDWQNIAFTIDNSTILVDNLKITNIITLKSEIEDGGDLIRVCMIDDFVFGLCSNGKIIQWNFQTETQIQIIETELSKYQFEKTSSIVFSSVGDSLYLSFQINYKTFVEIISYTNPSVNIQLSLESIISVFVEKVEEQLIYLKHVNYLLIYDREKNKFVKYVDGVTSVLVTKEYIFADASERYIEALKRSSEIIVRFFRPEIEGDVMETKLFDYQQEYLICFSASVHNNALSQYVTIWHIESNKMVYHSIFEDSLQDIIAILETGQLSRTFRKASDFIKDSAEDAERFFGHGTRDVSDLAYHLERFVKDKTEDCIIS